MERWRSDQLGWLGSMPHSVVWHYGSMHKISLSSLGLRLGSLRYLLAGWAWMGSRLHKHSGLQVLQKHKCQWSEIKWDTSTYLTLILSAPKKAWSKRDMSNHQSHHPLLIWCTSSRLMMIGYVATSSWIWRRSGWLKLVWLSFQGLWIDTSGIDTSGKVMLMCAPIRSDVANPIH